MLKRLRTKIVCFAMVIVAVMLCVIFGLVYHFTKSDLEAESLHMMQTVAAKPFQPGRPDELPDEVRLPYFTLQIGQRGEVIANGGGYYDLSDEAFLEELIDAVFHSHKQAGILKEYNLRFCRVSAPQSQCIVFADMSIEQATLSNLIRTSLVIGVLSLLVFLGISLYLAHIAVKPVDQAWRQQKQFVADASHELKTPLAVILTNAELLQSSSQSEEAKMQFSNSILTMSYQMRGLVESLLELARIDNGSVQTAFEELEFSQLVADAVLPFEPLYFEQGLKLSCCVEDGIRVKGSRSHLQQVIDILLDNAMKYSAPQGEIMVELKKQGRNCAFTVSNPGEPISSEDLKHIFKRFYRVDKVRSMNHSYGLGLSIAEGIVSEHHGKIWAESANGVNRFSVSLPSAP